MKNGREKTELYETELRFTPSSINLKRKEAVKRGLKAVLAALILGGIAAIILHSAPAITPKTVIWCYVAAVALRAAVKIIRALLPVLLFIAAIILLIIS